MGSELSDDHNRLAFERAGMRLQDPVANEEMFTRLRARLFGEDAPPRTIGRFTIVRVIGAGAMGTVYAAYDDRLDRGVAIKVIRRSPGGRNEQRLVREAQSLAKLSHPNIVPVFEVGTHGGQVYMVMELVHGQSLRQWLGAGERAPAEILAVFEQAGRGLSVAHAARIVHRDFKPDNVVLGQDGRVRVLDFGLAAPDVQGAIDTADERISASDDLLPRSRSVLTESGALVGTPAYMAPEVFRGREVTAKSDQFSFCVALWEALFGERPFEGSNVSVLMRNVVAGRPREPPQTRGVSPHVKRVLLRGLLPEPDDRFVSMDALLAALAHRHRSRWWVGGALLGVASVGGWWFAAREPSVCGGADQALGPAWDDERQAEVARALTGTELPYATQTWQRLQPMLDAYAAEWMAMHRENCEATHVFGRQSATMMEHRSACLADRRRSFGALTQVLAAADEDVVNNALNAVGSLPAIEPCRDERYVASAVPLPETSERREQLDELERRIALARAEADAGHRDRAIQLLEQVLVDVVEFGDRPLLGRAKMDLGLVQADRGEPAAAQTLVEAFEILLSVGDDGSAARIAATLVWVFGWQGSDFAAAETWLVSARALTQRAGNDLEQQATLAFHEGEFRDRAGDNRAAEDAFRRSLSLSTHKWGEGHLKLAHHHSALGSLQRVLGRYDEAHLNLERALAIWEKGLGPEHPDVAFGLNNLASLEIEAARFDAAEPLLLRALELWQRSSPDQPEIALAMQNLGVLHDLRGDYRKGESYFRQSLEFRRRVLGSDHLDTSASLVNLGASLYEQGRHAEARPALEEAIAIRSRKLEPDDARFATPLELLGDVQRAEGDLAGAESSYARAGAILREQLGPEHAKVGEIEQRLGELWLARNDPRRAEAHFERSLAIVTAAMGPEHPNNLAPLVQLARQALRRGDDVEAQPLVERIVQVVDTQTVPPEDAAEALILVARWRRGRGESRASIEPLLDTAERKLAGAEGATPSLRADLESERRALR